MEALAPRRQAILASVVREFIATATPVGSKTIVERCNLGVSPATIRNEMACLEEQGYLTHPYTSAGRVPTDEGYRYFVEHLMEEVRLPSVERLVIHRQLHQAHLETEQWLKLAAAVLARAVHGAALVSTLYPPRSRFKHLELVPVYGPAVFLVLVLQGGIVRRRMLTLAQAHDQTELSQTSEQLSVLLEGVSVRGARAKLSQLSPLGRQVATYVVEAMEQLDEWAAGEIYYDGLTNVLQQPEFTASENACQLIELMKEQGVLKSLIAGMLPPAVGHVRVIIGEEGGHEKLSECSLVLARYGVADRVSGALGVLGPRRMAYERAVSVVRYVASLMSDIIRKLYGNH